MLKTAKQARSAPRCSALRAAGEPCRWRAALQVGTDALHGPDAEERDGPGERRVKEPVRRPKWLKAQRPKWLKVQFRHGFWVAFVEKDLNVSRLATRDCDARVGRFLEVPKEL